MSDLREEIKAALLETLTSHIGAGSDLQTGNVFGDWLEVDGGNLDIEHLTSDVLTLMEPLEAKLELVKVLADEYTEAAKWIQHNEHGAEVLAACADDIRKVLE